MADLEGKYMCHEDNGQAEESLLSESNQDQFSVETETETLPPVEDGQENEPDHRGEETEGETEPLCDTDTDCTHSCASSSQGSPLPCKKFLAEQMGMGSPESCITNPVMEPLPLKKYLSTELGCGDEDCQSCLSSNNTTPLPYRKFKPPESDAGTDLLPVCRICQLPGDDDEILFSPCRCSGSLRYVHYHCLLKWIEVCSRKTKKPPKCELCFFPYIRHKRFKFHHWRLPKVSRRDKCLHTAFLFNLIIMIGCAVATVLCFLSDKGQITNLPKNKVELTSEEVITLACGVFFFVSFFIAMTVEIKAKHTVYKLFIKFLTQNTEWQIEPYDRSKDPMYNIHPSHNV
ncbi:E3 ubiquitin-protein ligase MARCHF4-like [Haliotis rufescens]|uniref:E3 ubiquitin-protein ligase MARCHF4-like n=1 Tax=Haliotis rufescens TaxID=6454 RepID=UPI001EB0AAC0|nr:E3 ubiquitin-protein ligase MARCHF4-like [Haliotis rufescens]XP_046361615.1 E3 ubiquitin-protein ligase MARCHF4-like [Haliotis rufescens]